MIEHRVSPFEQLHSCRDALKHAPAFVHGRHAQARSAEIHPDGISHLDPPLGTPLATPFALLALALGLAGCGATSLFDALARPGWHRGQKCELRPATIILRIAVPHTLHGSPVR